MRNVDRRGCGRGRRRDAARGPSVGSTTTTAERKQGESPCADDVAALGARSGSADPQRQGGERHWPLPAGDTVTVPATIPLSESICSCAVSVIEEPLAPRSAASTLVPCSAVIVPRYCSGFDLLPSVTPLEVICTPPPSSGSPLRRMWSSLSCWPVTVTVMWTTAKPSDCP